MFENDLETVSFRKTLKQVVKDLETISDSPIEEFQNLVIEKFERYSYEGEDEVVGFDRWADITKDGKYELEVRINHEHAYIFTLYATSLDGKITITNVL